MEFSYAKVKLLDNFLYGTTTFSFIFTKRDRGAYLIEVN